MPSYAAISEHFDVIDIQKNKSIEMITPLEIVIPIAPKLFSGKIGEDT